MLRTAQLKLQKNKLSFERSLGGPDRPVFGVDEVGRGCIAGPVITAAVCLSPEIYQSSLSSDLSWLSLVDDSKKLSEAVREQIYTDATMSPHVEFAIGEATVEEIDEINILHASLLAIDRATDALLEKVSTKFKSNDFRNRNFILIDGNRLPKKHGQHALAVVKGDSRSLSIGLASILAKVTRDRLMKQLASRFSPYGWDENMGYPTPKHKAQLGIHGVTPWHRKTFGPVRDILDRTLPNEPSSNGNIKAKSPSSKRSKANPTNEGQITFFDS